MATELAFDVLADDRASANIGKVGRSMKAMSADVELANVRMEKATKAANAAVEKYGKDSLQAREALAKLAKAEDTAEGAARKLGAAQKRAAQETEAAGEATEQAAGKLDGFKEAAGAAGVGAAAAIGKGFLDNLSIEAGRAKLTAQLGLTSQESERAGRLAGEVYRDNFGESMEGVNEALRVVWSSMRQIGQDSPAQIESATKSALTMSGVFGVDVTESVRAAATMVKTGLAANTTQAFDLMAKGFQTGANASDDLLETLNEYSVQFRKLGLDGSDAMSLLSQGLKAGARDTDYIADAIKEFSIRAVDGSKTTVDGFKSIGLSAGDTAAAFGRGGESARAAFGQVLAGIKSIHDPVEQERVGVELFGTKWEDLGPQVVTSLSLADNAIGNTAGTIDQMTASLGDTGAARLESWKRGLEGMVQSAAGAPGVLGATAAAMATIGPSALSSAGDIGMMVTGFQSLNIHGEKAKGVLKGVGIAAAALAAAQASGAIFGGESGVKGIETTTRALREMASGSQDTTGALKHLDDDLANLGTSGRGFGAFLEGLTGNMAGLAGDGAISAVNARMASLDQTMASLVTSGNADEAAAMFGMISARAKEQGTSLDTLNAALPQYQNALDGAAQANASAGQAAGKTAGEVQIQTDATKELTAALDANQSKLLQLRGGEVGYWASVDAATAAVAANGRTLDVHTEKGRANRTALDGQARAAGEYLRGLANSNTPAAEFNARLDQTRANLIRAATGFGMTKAQARAYADQLLGIPRAVNTAANLRTDRAVNAADGLLYKLRQIDGRTVSAYVKVETSGSVASIKGVNTARAAGGILPGPPSARDNMLIAAAGGEFVVNAAATSRHREALEAINSGRFQGFAAGGYVASRHVGAVTGGGAPVTVALNVYAPIGSQAQLEDWLQRGVTNLQRKGRLP